MKIKSSVKAFSPDMSMLVFCFGILIACPVRVYQMIKLIDSSTGFYFDTGSITIIILYAVLAVAALFIMLSTYLSARIPAALAPQGRHIPLAIASLLFAASLFYDAISGYVSSSTKSATIVQNVRSVTVLSHAQAIFAFLSCCYFLVFFISYISGNSFHKKLKILALCPVLWAVVKTLRRLTVTISFLRMSELLLELCGLVFLMAFFLVLARVVSQVNCKGSMWSVFGCGLTASLFILSYSIPRLMLTLTGNSSFIVSGFPLYLCDIGCVLFILVFIITTLRSGYSVEDVEKMNKEIAEAQEAAEKEQNQIAQAKTKAAAAAQSVTIAEPETTEKTAPEEETKE